MEKMLSQSKVNDRIVVIDDYILSKIPQLKDRELIVSVIKKSGHRIFCQYFSPDTGSGTIKLTIDAKIKVVGKEDFLTLANFLKQQRYQTNKPKNVTINTNGSVSEYSIAPGFWEQNPNNIRLKCLCQSFIIYSIPGSSIVKSFNY
jgi:hypothetical protein